MKVLVILAHPNLQESRANKALFSKIKNHEHITILDLYSRYGDCRYNAHLPEEMLEEDRRMMEKSDKIVFQFPFYWYQVPSLMKQWMDDVLKYGWCHHSGVEGPKYALQGKELGVAMVCGGSDISYTPTGYNQHYVTHFLNSFVQTARTLKMNMLQPFIVYGSINISDDDLEELSMMYLDFLLKS